MKKYILFGGYLLLLAYITSCDDGRIYEKTETLSEEGRTLKMSGKINGISKWPSRRPSCPATRCCPDR